MTGLFQDSFFDAVAKLGIPVVLIDSYVDDPSICCVGLEDEKGGYLATKHLLENGHRVIALASPPISPRALSNCACRAIVAPWRNTACRTTRRLSLRRKFPCRRARSWGINSAHVPKSRGFSPPRIFWQRASCPGCTSAGKCADKSIVGFDDHYISQLAIPGLTTIHQDSEKLKALWRRR